MGNLISQLFPPPQSYSQQISELVPIAVDKLTIFPERYTTTYPYKKQVSFIPMHHKNLIHKFPIRRCKSF